MVKKTKKKILFVSHDGNRAGAQIFIFNIMLYLKNNGFDIVLLILNDWGSLKTDFEKNFETHYLNTSSHDGMLKKVFKKEVSVLKKIKNTHTIDLIYANTIASVGILSELDDIFKVPILTHIHELSYSIHQYGPDNGLEMLEKYSRHIIACSNAVSKNLTTTNIAIGKKIVTIHSFVENDTVLKIHETKVEKNLRTELNLPSDTFLVGTCGNSDWRKAPDVFLQIAKEVSLQANNVHFVWIGIQKNDLLFYQLQYDLEKLNIKNIITWLEPTPKAISIINMLDAFLVCSREDPFPLVMLEAALCKKPILGFNNTGGAEEFIESDCGYLSEYCDVKDIAKNILKLADNKKICLEFGENAQRKVLELYSFENSVTKIIDLINITS